MEYAAGAISGLCQTMVGHPFDTYKVLLQNNSLKTNMITKVNPFVGIKFPMTSSVINCSITFGLNDTLKKDYGLSSNVSGFISGGAISPIVFWFDNFKIKRQMNHPFTFREIFWAQGKFATFSRETIAFSVYFSVFDYLYKKQDYSLYFSGAVSGLANWTLTYPIDIVKTRQVTFNMNIYEAIKMGNMWKGYSMCAIRAILVNSVGFYVYEKCNNFFNT